MQTRIHLAFALLSSASGAFVFSACGDDISEMCSTYCKCNSCGGDTCQVQTKAAREAAVALGCGPQFEAYLGCTKLNYDCTQEFNGAGACKSEAQAALDCGIVLGIGQRDCEGKGHYVDSLVAGCDSVSEKGTFAPSSCDPVPSAIVDCWLACALQYDCSTSLEVCLDGCPDTIQ